MMAVLHIGSHKTGCSAFQEILYDFMKSGEWSYPSTGIWHEDRSHNQLGIYFWDDLRIDLKLVNFEKMVDSLILEIRGKKRVIISSEMLEKVPLLGRVDRLHFVLGKLRESGYQIRVIYTVRRQDYLINSIFKQWVISFDTLFSDNPLRMANDEAPHLFYTKVVSSWENLVGVGNVFVVPYLEGNFPQTLKALALAAQIDLTQGIQNIVIANPSLEGYYLRFKHYINRFIRDRPFNDRLNEKLFEINNSSRNPVKTSVFGTGDRARFLDKFLLDNEKIGCYFPGSAGVWLNGRDSEFETFRVADSSAIEIVLSQLRINEEGIFRKTREILGD